MDKGLDILELLAGVEHGLTQAEIAKQLGRSPNEFYRMLDRLQRRGYVARVDGERFALTLKLFGLAQLHAPIRRLVSFATPLMRELAKKTEQANHMVVFDRGRAVVVAQQEAPTYWGYSIRIGSQIGLFDTGSGHVMLAFASPEQRASMLDANRTAHEPDTIPPDLERRLHRIREQGYESMSSVQTAGVFNLSAPVLSTDGSALAALTIPFITHVNAPNAPDPSDATHFLTEIATRLSEGIGAQRAKPDATPQDLSQTTRPRP
nr:IclR family transcriptional regulator [Oceaniglobus trochenteri]